MKSLMITIVLAFTFISCSKEEERSLDQAELFVGKWKQTYGISTYQGNVDRYVPDYDIFLLVNEDSGLALHEYMSNGLRIRQGDYDLLHRNLVLQDIDQADKYNRYDILDITKDKLRIRVVFSDLDILELGFDKVK